MTIDDLEIDEWKVAHANLLEWLSSLLAGWQQELDPPEDVKEGSEGAILTAVDFPEEAKKQ